MVVAAFGEVSSAVDKVIHVYTCGLQSANLSQETGKPVAGKISSLGSITATFQCFCATILKEYIHPHIRRTAFI